MDETKNYPGLRDSQEKKHKKKKHHRSRSGSQHKKHKRSRSRSEHKKDKKKKQKSSHDRHQRHRSSQNQNSKSKPIGSKNEKGDDIKRRQDSPIKEKADLKKDRDRQQRKQKDQKDRDHKSRDFNSRDDKYRSHRQKSRERSPQKQDKKQNDKYSYQNHKRKDPSDRKEQRNNRQRSYERDRNRQKSRYDRYDKPDRYESRRRDRERQTFRSRSRSKNGGSPQRPNKFSSKKRSRSREYEQRNDRRRPQRRRQSNRFDSGRFRFDSPPKSDQSDMSDDPQKMQKLSRMKAQKQLVTSKADRKLYLGNLPPNITSQQLMDMLNTALKKMEINTQQEGDSIISAWISPQGVGHYAFVQFRTAQQATNGLALNGASLFGYQLKLGRPKQYIEYNKQLLSKFGTDSSIDTIIKKVAAMGGEVVLQVSQKIICPPSKILVLKHIVTVEELAIDQEYQEIYDDVLDMAKRYGDVIKVVIPRPHEVFDLEEVRTRVKGLGYIFLEYKTVEQAIFARKQLVQKQFSGRSVACSFFNQRRFRQCEYDIMEKVVIDF